MFNLNRRLRMSRCRELPEWMAEGYLEDGRFSRLQRLIGIYIFTETPRRWMANLLHSFGWDICFDFGRDLYYLDS